MIKFYGDTPSLAIWESVQDFKHISHLEMISGFDEVCTIAPLDEIGRFWPLESLLLGDVCGEDINTNHLRTIKSLTLLYCCGLSFNSISLEGPSQLNELIIIENDACDHFIKMKEETCLINNLSQLKIQSTNGCDFSHQYERECFGKTLIQCNSLKSLDLTLHDLSDDSPRENYLIDLPYFFPSNIEILRFRGPPSLTNHLSVWQKCIEDPKWLPKLKSIKFSLDVTFNGKEIPLETENIAHQQCLQLLNDLESFRPSITISTFSH
ncbi:unnamed protein product [Adineta ricciae]|nr:unnamed protein product [Adineta ricciae]